MGCLHPDLAPLGDSELLQKGTGGEDGYSGFTVRDPESGETEATSLEHLLRDRGIERVVVVGLAADVCVKETALDAAGKGFETVVLREATRGVERHEGDTQRAFEELQFAGARVE